MNFARVQKINQHLRILLFRRADEVKKEGAIKDRSHERHIALHLVNSIFSDFILFHFYFFTKA